MLNDFSCLLFQNTAVHVRHELVATTRLDGASLLVSKPESQGMFTDLLLCLADGHQPG
jgi:hypothetical protein